MNTTTYVRGFIHDLFVSYAHTDDTPGSGAREGWVTVLVNELRNSLQLRGVGGAINLWNDKLLDDFETVSDQLVEAVRGAAILIAVLSPSYIQSRWCQRELKIFLREIDARNRSGAPIIIVEMLPVNRGERPDPFHDRNTRKFWEYDEEAQAEIPLGWPMLENLNNEDLRKFKKHVAGLAAVLHHKLKDLKEQESKKGVPDNGASDARIFTQNDAPVDHHIIGQVFINAEQSDSDVSLANRVKAILDRQGHVTFLPPTMVKTMEAGATLMMNYMSCKAAVLVSANHRNGDNKDWLIGQLRQLNKTAALRARPLEFLWIVTHGPGHAPSWLIDLLDMLTVDTRKEKRILHIDDLEAVTLERD